MEQTTAVHPEKPNNNNNDCRKLLLTNVTKAAFEWSTPSTLISTVRTANMICLRCFAREPKNKNNSVFMQTLYIVYPVEYLLSISQLVAEWFEKIVSNSIASQLTGSNLIIKPEFILEVPFDSSLQLYETLHFLAFCLLPNQNLYEWTAISGIQHLIFPARLFDCPRLQAALDVSFTAQWSKAANGRASRQFTISMAALVYRGKVRRLLNGDNSCGDNPSDIDIIIDSDSLAKNSSVLCASILQIIESFRACGLIMFAEAIEQEKYSIGFEVIEYLLSHKIK
jgi:hypothetical protein